ncbi:hypothetical protein EHP00_1438 [Ecytonucleospora hepatopenaei]|uniref:Ribosome production factor 2 homolog n=1 Tax=Ecytonucleospora hepatopenaei TaxID=646526 RepID=A0A1W0E7F2_9MICR|nr:hypothetical protein EHP00_1438 [Ecytonucleospora hepatopenaei]
MTKIKKSDLKDCVLFMKNTKNKSLVRDLLKIAAKDNYFLVPEEVDGIQNKEKCCRIAASKKCKFFVSFKNEMVNKTKSDKIQKKNTAENNTESNSKNITEDNNNIDISDKQHGLFSLGRIVGNTPSDIFTFKLLSYTDKFDNVLPFEPFSKFLFLSCGIKNKNLVNTMQELFSSKIQQVDVDAIEYVVLFYYNEMCNNYILTVLRIKNKHSLSFANKNLEKTENTKEKKTSKMLGEGFDEIGPRYELFLINEYKGNSTEENQKKKAKKNKNISKTVTKDTVGRLYVKKQDLRDVKVRSNIKKTN